MQFKAIHLDKEPPVLSEGEIWQLLDVILALMDLKDDWLWREVTRREKDFLEELYGNQKERLRRVCQLI